MFIKENIFIRQHFRFKLNSLNKHYVPEIQQKNEGELKETPLAPRTFRGSALSSPSLRTDRATLDPWGRAGSLSGTAASPEPQRNKGWPNRGGRTATQAKGVIHSFISTVVSRVGARRLTQCNTSSMGVTSIGFISSKGWLFVLQSLLRTAVNDEISWHEWTSMIIFIEVWAFPPPTSKGRAVVVNAPPFVRQSTRTAASPWPCWAWMEINPTRMRATRRSKTGYMCDTLLKVWFNKMNHVTFPLMLRFFFFFRMNKTSNKKNISIS